MWELLVPLAYEESALRSVVHKGLSGPRGFGLLLLRYVLLKSPFSSVDYVL